MRTPAGKTSFLQSFEAQSHGFLFDGNSSSDVRVWSEIGDTSMAFGYILSRWLFSYSTCFPPHRPRTLSALPSNRSTITKSIDEGSDNWNP